MSVVTTADLSERALETVSCGLRSVLRGFLLPQRGLVLPTLQVTDGQFKREFGILAITYQLTEPESFVESTGSWIAACCEEEHFKEVLYDFLVAHVGHEVEHLNIE